MTNAQVQEILDRHLPGPLLAPEVAPPFAEYCCTECSRWWPEYGVGVQAPWPCDAYRLAEWNANLRAMPTAKQLYQHSNPQAVQLTYQPRSYEELFPGGD